MDAVRFIYVICYLSGRWYHRELQPPSLPHMCAGAFYALYIQVISCATVYVPL